MFKERNLALGAVLTVAVLAACGGGGGGGGSVPATGGNGVTGGTTVATATPIVAATATAAPGQQLASVSITLARGTFSQSATTRRTSAIGAGTRSIVFTLLQQNGTSVTGSPQAFGLTAASAGCTVNSGTGNLTCTLPVNAPVGSDVFLAQTYDGLGGTGNLTGSGALALSIGVNTANSANIVLNAQVASVFLVAGNNLLQSTSRGVGVQGTRRPRPVSSGVTSTPIFVIAIDSSGNTILNPSAYSSPIYLQLSFITGLTADITLQAVYAANDPSPCAAGSTVSVNTWFASLPICSPGDSVSAALSATGGNAPSVYAFIYGYTSATSLAPTPAPSTLPSSLPSTPPSNSFVTLLVVYPIPSPTPSVPVGTLPVIGQ